MFLFCSQEFVKNELDLKANHFSSQKGLTMFTQVIFLDLWGLVQDNSDPISSNEYIFRIDWKF